MILIIDLPMVALTILVVLCARYPVLQTLLPPAGRVLVWLAVMVYAVFWLAIHYADAITPPDDYELPF